MDFLLMQDDYNSFMKLIANPSTLFLVLVVGMNMVLGRFISDGNKVLVGTAVVGAILGAVLMSSNVGYVYSTLVGLAGGFFIAIGMEKMKNKK